MPRWLWRAGRRSRIRLLLGAVLLASLIAGLPLLWSRAALHASLSVVGMILYGWASVSTLIIPVLTSRAIARERLQGTWDGVILTRLTPAEIIFGKLFAALFPVWAVGLFFLLIFCIQFILVLIFSLSTAGEMIGWGIFICLMLLFNIFSNVAVGAMGLYISMCCANPATALILSYGIIIFSCGLYIPLGVIALPVLIIMFKDLDNSKRKRPVETKEWLLSSTTQ